MPIPEKYCKDCKRRNGCSDNDCPESTTRSSSSTGIILASAGIIVSLLSFNVWLTLVSTVVLVWSLAKQVEDDINNKKED